MASSDDEEDLVPQSVSNFHFVDKKEEPISFSVLPVQWGKDEPLEGDNQQIFLHGVANDGIQKIYKQVKAWKFDLSDTKPVISVLSKENKWIKLEKPRKSFEDTIRTILITVHCLHIAKANPEISGKSMWDQLNKVFSLYEVRPSMNDLVDHMHLITEALKRDEKLAESKFLVTFVDEKPSKTKLPDEDVQPTSMAGFIVDDAVVVREAMGDESDEEEAEDLFDSVCSICDNGGDLLCCEGRCMRSFHATVEAGAESSCASLGYSEKEVEAIQNFFCPNCKHKQHQCFYCGKLGSSNKSSGAEVFSCVSATCGRFYHPHCVAKLLHRDDETAAQDLQKKIVAGESFICPVHKCIVCKQGENKTEHDLNFAVCRRCPKSYHRKCLPRKISFDDDDEDEDVIQRAWDGLLPNRILIYCLKHEIDEDIGTPVRNHIKFPYVEGQKKRRPFEQPPSREKVLSKKKILEEAPRDKSAKPPKYSEKASLGVKEGTRKINEKRASELESLRRSRLADASGKSMKDDVKSTVKKMDKSTADDSRISLKGDKTSLFSKGSGQVKVRKLEASSSETEGPNEVLALKKKSSSLPVLDADTQKRILALMKESASAITLEKIIRKQVLPSTYAQSSKYVVDKTITQGKVEGSVEALRTALQKLESGCTIEDAKAVCEPQVLQQMIKWKNKLKVYLSPFLFGQRYTSFGRHFTKVDKLKEIVDRLHWYAQSGDTIVDFCCGSNDFSILMKKKLEETGKKCFYKNFDVITPKNDFNFEQRDWMSVQTRELPKGSQLIMGLNPPFGVKASLANKFVDKALEFKPKLIILIVPPETERLDKKNPPYDLIWEDDQKLSGKSFYLPGSVDVNDKQIEQWNVKPPLLYLWSRREFTVTHKAIAEKHNHVFSGERNTEALHLEEKPEELHVEEKPEVLYLEEKPKELRIEEKRNKEPKFIEHHHPIEHEDSMVIDMQTDDDPTPVNARRTEEFKDVTSVDPDPKETPPRKTNDKETPQKNNNSRGKNTPNGSSKKRKRGGGKGKRGSGGGKGKHGSGGGREKSPQWKQNSPKRRSLSLSRSRSPSPSNHIPRQASPIEAQAEFPLGVSGSGSQFTTGGYSDSRHAISNDIARKYTDPFQTPGTGYRSYTSEVEERYRRDSDVHSHLQTYNRMGTDPLARRSSYLVGPSPGYGSGLPTSSFGLTGAGPPPSLPPSYNRGTTSAMDRYAPRLDEMNHARVGIGNVGYDPLAQRPGLRHDPMGFVPAPRGGQYPHQNSSGWLNE